MFVCGRHFRCMVTAVLSMLVAECEGIVVLLSNEKQVKFRPRETLNESVT